MPHPRARAGVAEVMAAIGVAVVGHDSLDADAGAREPSESPLEEGDGAGLALVGQDLGVSQARGIIDRDVQVLPADAAVAVDHAGVAAGDAVPDAGDLAELLGVDVHELAGALALVAHDRRGRIEALEAAEATTAQDAADGRERQAEAARDHGRGKPLAAERLDRGDLLGRPPALAGGGGGGGGGGRGGGGAPARPPPPDPPP